MRLPAVLLLAAAFMGGPAAAVTFLELPSSPFGRVVLAQGDEPKGLVVLFSADPPRRPGGLATALADLDYLVAQVAPSGWPASASGGKKEQACADVARAVLALRQELAASHGNLTALPPLVVGAGPGAALAYLAAVQARADELHAAVSIDFHPTLPKGISPCQGKNTPGSTPMMPDPLARLNAPWFVFQPQAAQGEGSTSAATFLSRVKEARLTMLKGPAGPPYDGAALPEFMALMQWLDPRIAHQVTGAAALTDLPLTEVPAEKPGDDRLAVIITGDGGWAALDRAVAAHFAERGIATVGLDSLSFFWKKRTPEETAVAVASIIEWYTEHWHKKRVILFGYSFGADVLPFVVNRLPQTVVTRIDRVVFAGLGPRAPFEFHLTNWLGDLPADALPVPEEVKRMPPIKGICIYGSEEGNDTVCPEVKSANIIARELPGDHHFDEDYARVAEIALEDQAEKSR